MLFGIIKNLVIVLVLFGALYMVTQMSPQIKKQADTQIAKVLGTKSTPQDKSKPLPDALKDDASTQLDIAKDKAMHVDLNDVVEAIGRLKKVPKDAQNVFEDTRTGIESFLKNK